MILSSSWTRGNAAVCLLRSKAPFRNTLLILLIIMFLILALLLLLPPPDRGVELSLGR